MELTREAMEHAITQHEEAIANHQAELAAVKALLADMQKMDAEAPAEPDAEAGGAEAAQ